MKKKVLLFLFIIIQGVLFSAEKSVIVTGYSTTQDINKAKVEAIN